MNTLQKGGAALVLASAFAAALPGCSSNPYKTSEVKGLNPAASTYNSVKETNIPVMAYDGIDDKFTTAVLVNNYTILDGEIERSQFSYYKAKDGSVSPASETVVIDINLEDPTFQQEMKDDKKLAEFVRDKFLFSADNASTRPTPGF